MNFGAEDSTVMQMPLVEALWWAIKKKVVLREDVFRVLEKRYRLEYDEVKGELRK